MRWRVLLMAGALLTACSPASEGAQAVPHKDRTVSSEVPVDVTRWLPRFHRELRRMVVRRTENRPALLVISVEKKPEPRQLGLTLLEWDKHAYAAADRSIIDCRFLEQLVVDEDQAIFIGCTGGASAHFLYAVRPTDLELSFDPAPQDDTEPAGWLVANWKNRPTKGRPDDLTVEVNPCLPDCASGRDVRYRLDYQSDFEHWEITGCTTADGQEREVAMTNASAVDVLPDCASEPGDTCVPGGLYDCIDPDGDGVGEILVGGGDCVRDFADDPGLCDDPDGDHHAGYPD